jgi:hypothetical protein
MNAKIYHAIVKNEKDYWYWGFVRPLVKTLDQNLWLVFSSVVPLRRNNDGEFAAQLWERGHATVGAFAIGTNLFLLPQ